MINLSNTTPVPPNGGTNILWQTDASGDVSGYYAITKQTLTPVSGALTIDASTGSSFLINVNQVIGTVSIINAGDGQEITLLWAQDSTGHAVDLPANLLGALAVSATANTHTCQKFTYNAGDTNWYAIGVAGM